MRVKDVAQGVPVFKTFEIKDVTDKSTDGAMRLEFTISNEDTDRDGDTIDAKGWTLQNFQKNPVVMFAHDYTRLPSGRALKTWAVGAHLKSLVEFTPDELYDDNYHGIRGSTVFRFYKAGFLNAVSAGFYPVAWEPMQGKGAIGTHFTSQDLIEFSFVPVPSNPNALVARDGFSTTEIKSMKKELKRWVKDAEALCQCPTKALGVSDNPTGGALVPESGEKGDINMKPEEGTPDSKIEKGVNDSDKSALSAAIGKENLQDLSAYHRRLHMFAAQGNPLTGFSNADMDWLHAQVESAMCKLHKAEETECASPSPLEWKAVKAVKPAGDKKPPEESPEEEAGEKPAEEEEEEAEETEEEQEPKDPNPKEEEEKCSHISEATGAIAARENGKKAKAEGGNDDEKNKEVEDVTPPTEKKAVEPVLDEAVTKFGAKLSKETANKLNEALGHFSEGFGHHDKAFNFQNKLSNAQDNAAAEHDKANEAQGNATAEHDEAMKCYQKGISALNVINGEKPAEGSPAEEAAETPAEEAAEIAAGEAKPKPNETIEKNVDESNELSFTPDDFTSVLKEFVAGLKKDLNL